MSVEAHILTYDGDRMTEWSLRHYCAFCDRVVVHDGGPEHRSRQKVEAHFPVAEWEAWDTGGKLDDQLAMDLKNRCWAGSKADWVIVADCDELIYFPQGTTETLSKYSKMGAAMIRPHGFEMFAEAFPDPAVHDGAQITALVQDGAPDDKWYAKPILFSPQRVRQTGFGIGAHEARPLFSNGKRYDVGSNWPQAVPPTFLLHFHSGVGLESDVAAAYDAQRTRLSKANVAHGWGNFAPGHVHAAEKRAMIRANLRRVIGAT